MGHKIKYRSRRYWENRYPQVSKKYYTRVKEVYKNFNITFPEVPMYFVKKIIEKGTKEKVLFINVYNDEIDDGISMDLFFDSIKLKKYNFIDITRTFIKACDIRHIITWEHGIRNVKTFRKFSKRVLNLNDNEFAYNDKIETFKNYYKYMIDNKKYEKLLKVMNIMFPDDDEYDLEKKCIESMINSLPQVAHGAMNG